MVRVSRTNNTYNVIEELRKLICGPSSIKIIHSTKQNNNPLNSDKYILEKTIWTEKDFDLMGWHDSNVYGISFSDQEEVNQSFMCFDIDYIFQWVNPKEGESHFSFWVSPCTLMFENVIDLQMEIESGLISPIGLEIADIIKIENETDNEDLKWRIDFQTGFMEFKSSGFKQIVRKEPIFTSSQCLTFRHRDGISFSQNPYDHQ